MWIVFSLLGAFFQAVQMAVKKKVLQTEGINSYIAFLSHTLAGIILGLILFIKTGSVWSEIGNDVLFWKGMIWLVSVNAIATYFLYKALDLADLSYLMPYMTITSITLIIPAMIKYHEVPTMFGFLGIAIIVFSAIILEKARTLDHQQHKKNRKGLYYFLVTAVCYTMGPTAQAIVTRESSPLFATALSYSLVGLSFFPMIFIFKETSRFKPLICGPSRNWILYAILLSSIAIAASNLSINAALATNTISNVFGLKRTMPLFAFLISYFYFKKERENLPIKLRATLYMAIGAVVVTMFG